MKKMTKKEKRNLVVKVYESIAAICAIAGLIFLGAAEEGMKVFGSTFLGTITVCVVGIALFAVAAYIVNDINNYRIHSR